MPLWDLENPPKFATKIGLDTAATDMGWQSVKSKQKEIVAAIGLLATRANEANITSVIFDKPSYEGGDALAILVKYNEFVNVTPGSSIVVTSTGLSGDITLYAKEQLNMNTVVFDADISENPVLIPEEVAVLSISAHNISGTIIDSNDGITLSELAISTSLALDAGTREIV